MKWESSVRAVLSNLRSLTHHEQKVDLFLNTMRNVYEGLRITKLQQENLELYFKQSSPS